MAKTNCIQATQSSFGVFMPRLKQRDKSSAVRNHLC